MRKVEVHETTKTGQIKASPIESEIHPSHKTLFYALCISLLRRAVTFENLHQNDAPFLRRRWLFRIRFSSRPLSLPRNVSGKTICGRPPSVQTISFPASMIQRKARPLIARKRAYARNRSPKVALAGKTMTAVRKYQLKKQHHMWTF